MRLNPLLLADWYKIGHPFQYPKNTITVYSNLTPRKSRIPGVDKMVMFGLQGFIKEYLIECFNEGFFSRPKEIVLAEYKRRVVTSLGSHLPSYKHIEDLHDLGYLPLEIKALPEGTMVEMRVPVLTIKNTNPKFYWLTNFVETLMSCSTWQAMTSATIAFQYKKIFIDYAKKTGMPLDFIQWQGHDFSMRGMSSLESAYISGAGHLLSFSGTDSIPAIDYLEQYYNADADKELIGGSVAATEHAVMCAGTGVEGEFKTFKRLITEVYPSGIVSIVSDTFDLWDVLRDYMPLLKERILARDGKVVIRPDSGDPVKIITGYKSEEYDAIDDKYICKETGKNLTVCEIRGVIENLWHTFGGTLTDKGFKLLDSHVGAIYGDSITPTRATQICQRLMDKGFASQCIFGIGSYTYQYNTRDTFGMAVKATYIEIEEVDHLEVGDDHGHYGFPVMKTRGIEIYKDPVTDDGTKKSAKGLLQVQEEVVADSYGHLHHSRYVLNDQVSWEEEQKGALKTVFLDGKLVREFTLNEIRNRLNSFL